MTPVLWLDPVAACAVTKAITPAVGLGQLVCATCRGRTRFEGDGFVCSDCNGSGLVQPSGPTTMLIATKLEVGGMLAMQYTGDGEAERGMNPPKQYRAEYAAPAPATGVDSAVANLL